MYLEKMYPANAIVRTNAVGPVIFKTVDNAFPVEEMMSFEAVPVAPIMSAVPSKSVLIASPIDDITVLPPEDNAVIVSCTNAVNPGRKDVDSFSRMSANVLRMSLLAAKYYSNDIRGG